MKRYNLVRDDSGAEPRYRIEGIELFQPHFYPGSQQTGEKARRYTEADAERMVARSRRGVKTFIGHNYPGVTEERAVRGKFVNIRLEEAEGPDGKPTPTVVGDLDGADPVLALNLARGFYPYRSPEFSPKTMEMKGVAWLGSRDPFFKHFPPVTPEVDKTTLGTIKADAKEFAVRDANAVESDLTAIREEIEDKGDVDTGGIDANGSKSDTNALIERLTGVVTDLAKDVTEMKGRYAADQKVTKLEKKVAKEPVAAREDADEDETEDDEEKAALREEIAALRLRLDASDDTAIRTALRSDITALRAKFAIGDKTADAIIDVCARISDAKDRKAKFEALTVGFREAPLEDAAPEAEGDPAATAKGIKDPKVAKMYSEAETVEDRKAIRSAYDDLVALRKDTPRDQWEGFYINDAETYVRAHLEDVIAHR